MLTNEQSKEIHELADACRRCLTAIDVNIGASTTVDDLKEAITASQSLDTFVALMGQKLKALSNA